MAGRGFNDCQLSDIGKSQEFVPGKDQVPWSETILTPFDRSGFQFNALQGPVSVFLETEHSIKMTLMVNRRAPMIEHVVWFAPYLFA